MIDKQELDVLLKNNCDLMDEVETLKSHIKSLMIKLKGVRQARKRDAANYEWRLNLIEDLHHSEVKAIIPSKMKIALDYQRIQSIVIRDTLVESGKITLKDWIDAEYKADMLWKEMHA